MLRRYLIFACILCCLLTSPCVFAQSVTDIGPGYSVNISNSGTIFSYNGLEYYRNSTSSYVYPGSYGIYGPPSVTVMGGSLAISGGIFATTGTFSIPEGTIVYSPVDVLSGDVVISGGDFAGSGGGIQVTGGNVSIVGGSMSGTPFVSFYAGNEYNETGSAFTATGGTTKIAGGSFHVASATIPGVGLNILWGGVVDLFGTFSQSTTIINGSGYGTIRGTLLDGEAIDTTYSVNSATLEFNVGTPPFAITAAKLGLPRLVTDPSGNAFFTESVYLKGVGQGTFSGHWVQTGLDYPTIGKAFTKSVDLSSGSWVQGDTLSLPWDNVHNKSYTVAFSLDAPTSVQTDQLKATVTGFRPALNEWSFPNSIYSNLLDDIFKWSFDGECYGYVSTAQYYYDHNQPLPGFFSRLVNTQIFLAEAQGNAWTKAIDWPRYTQEGKMSDANNIEADNVLGLLNGAHNFGPSVIILPGIPSGHAVLASAGYSSPSLVDDSGADADASIMQEINDVRTFTIYDPNYPNNPNHPEQFRGMYLGNFWGSQKLQFYPSPADFHRSLTGIIASTYSFFPK